MKNEVKLYEVLYLLKPNLTQEEVNQKVDFYQSCINENDSQALVQNRGKRFLSYPIKGFESAMYIQMVYRGNGELVKLINKELNNDEAVLRGITTQLLNLNSFD